MKKFALISLGLPPSQSGQSMVLYHLLKQFDPQNYCLITLKNFHQYKYLGNCSTQLKAKYFFLHPDYQIIRLMTKTASLVRSALLLEIILKLRIYQVKKILQKEQCKVVIGCTGDLFDPPAAFLAAKELGIPFILYTFDFYSRQWTPSGSEGIFRKKGAGNDNRPLAGDCPQRMHEAGIFPEIRYSGNGYTQPV